MRMALAMVGAIRSVLTCVLMRSACVPEDVSVIGCDDITVAGYYSPALTTIRTNFNRLGTLAAGEIIRLIQGQPGQRIIQQSQLIVRKSCKPCPETQEIYLEESV